MLERQGHHVTVDWTVHSCAGDIGPGLQDKLVHFAQLDRDGVRTADALIMLQDDASRGGFCELGMALAWGKLVLVVGGRTSYPHRAPIFYALPEAHHFEYAADAVAWLTWLDSVFAEKTDEQVREVSR
jgi:hypothetical protein